MALRGRCTLESRSPDGKPARFSVESRSKDGLATAAGAVNRSGGGRESFGFDVLFISLCVSHYG